ncbi:MAG: hypothetical protein NC898_06110 [Candidatus Omnitrophica bacterium]|nr:hypothetical protein [Candidatus Omnitrophota bacterium]
MKRLKLGLILSVLLGLGITYSALAGFNPFLNDPPAQIEPSSPSGSSMEEMNNLYNLLSNPSPSTPVFINEPELPDNIEDWMEFLSNPDNYEFISQFIKWLEKNPSNIDAFVKYILKNYERMGGLFNQIQREIGIYGFVGKNYNLYLVRNNNAFIELAITDKDNNLLLGAVFNSQRQMVSSIKQEEENDKKVYSVTTQDKTYKSYKLALGKEIRYVPGDGYSSDFSFSQGTMEIKIDGNFRLVVGDGSLLLNVNGRKIVLPPGSQIKETAAGWNVTLTDSTIIFIDKDGSTMEVTLPNGVGSFALDISELVKIEIEQKENMLTINGYEIAAVCYDEEGDCQRKVLSLSISQAGGVVVKQGEAIVTVNGAKITLSKEMSLRFEGTDAIVTKNDKISYKINKDGWVSQITIAGINIPLPRGVKPSDIEIDAEKNSVTVSIEGKTYTFKIETVAGSTSLPIDRVNIVLPTDQTLVLPPGASLANEGNKLIVVNARGEKIAEISLNEDGSFSINGIQFVINDVSGFQVFLGIDDNGGVWIKAGKNGVEETISLPRETKVVNIFKQGDKLIISYTDDKNNTSSIVIQGNPSGSTTPQPGGVPQSVEEALGWLENGTDTQKENALRYLMGKYSQLNSEQKNKLADLLSKQGIWDLLLRLGGWEDFLKKIFEDRVVRDEHKLLLAERLLGKISELLNTKKELLTAVLNYLLKATPGPSEEYNQMQNLLEQYLLLISQQAGGRDFLRDYVSALATSAVGKDKHSSEYNKLEKIIKTMLRLGFRHFLEEIAYKLSDPNNPDVQKQAAKLIYQIMYDDWLKWLEENPEQLAEFLNWLKEHPDKIGDFLDWIKQRGSDDKLWNAFLNLLTAGNAEAQRAVEILLKHDAGIKFLAELLEGLNSPLRSDERKRRNLAWALRDLINYLSTKAEGGDAEIKRAVAALFLAMARYGNEKALGALKSLARKGDISAIQAIQYLITDNGRSDLIDFLIELASQSQELRNKVLEALGLLVKDKNVDMRIKEGAIRTLIEIAKRGADEATQIAAINTLWALGIWLADSKNENRGERWRDLFDKIIEGLKKIINSLPENVKALAETVLNDLEYRKNNQGNPTPTPTSNPSNNNSSNNNNRTNPSGTGPTAGFNLGTGTEGRAPKGNNAEGKNQSPRGENPNNSLSASLRENIFNNPSLSTPLQRLEKAKGASSKLIERFKKVDKRSGQKGRILKKKLEKKLREKGLSEEEIKEKLKEFSQKLSENDEEAKKYLAGLGFSQEEIAKDFQDAEGFFSAEDQEKYLRENLGIEGKEAEEILRMTDELAQIEFLTDAGFSESTAKLIVNPALVKDKLEAFFNLVEKIEQKLNLEDNPEARKEIADLLTEALFNGDITLENAQELLDDPEKPGEKVTRLELLLRDLLKRIESRSQSVFSPFLP